MQAGLLDRRVSLSVVTSANTGTGYVETVAHLADVWASRKDVSDSEKAAAGSVEGVLRSRFMVRWSSVTSSLKPKDALTEGGLTFRIVGIKEVGRRDMIEITAEARLD
ncbi:MAG: hypothetical protein BGP11_08485 [Rhodobacterales bacterium 65-51]|uniref:head-tail adaptor protein n=1 Tax=uncultured Gemmobacter sp. TaxID=1095917 RepID=UPI0009621033|nr:head-tail adaptor protein [uncultured Gemmobacter sp.]OJY34643.1 MAG: hypothetical protein BGP11_08485 [Rhodobacterales bacterium 65-51]